MPTAAGRRWDERKIGRAVCRQVLLSKCIVLVENTSWTGHECDLLGVTMDLRVIDVEVKISRADLKADAAKDKWWHRRAGWLYGTEPPPRPREWPREWPPKVWKHYYALPRDLWDVALFDALPSPNSGVLLMTERSNGAITIAVERRATPNRDAERLSPADVLDVARLANLRMWDALERRAAVEDAAAKMEVAA